QSAGSPASPDDQRQVRSCGYRAAAVAILKTSFLPCASVTLYVRVARDSAEAAVRARGVMGKDGRFEVAVTFDERRGYVGASRAASAGHSALARRAAAQGRGSDASRRGHRYAEPRQGRPARARPPATPRRDTAGLRRDVGLGIPRSSEQAADA